MNPLQSIGRRRFLQAAGIVSVAVAGGGVWRAYDQGVFSRGKGQAYEPWNNWRGEKLEGPLALVPAAILAANPHNTQPWLFQVQETSINLFADGKRNLGAIDPYLREMHIGLGCALENLLLAAQAKGYKSQLTLEPKGADSSHVARIDLSPAPPLGSELYDAMPRRHTNRGPYDQTRPLSPDVFSSLESLREPTPEVALQWFHSAAERARLGALLVDATKAIIEDEAQAEVSFGWYRHRWEDIQRYRDGLTLDTFGMPAAIRVIAKMLPRPSRKTFDSGWLQTTRDVQVATAGAFGILTASDWRDRRLRVQAGRLWQRMHLWATANGIAMQPMSQLTERADREMSLGIPPKFGEALKELLERPDQDVLMLFRMGYPARAAYASPRRAVKDVLITT
jgi:hypothetical protein